MPIDPYFYLFKSFGFPSDHIPVTMPSDFKVYLLCDTPDKRNIFVYLDRQEFGLNSKRDNDDVIRLFRNLAKKLALCDKAIDLFDYYDTSELHEAHKTKVNNAYQTVYRIRKGALRLYLIFIGADIVLFRLATKRQDKISKSEEKIIDDRVTAILAYPSTSNQFLERVK